MSPPVGCDQRSAGTPRIFIEIHRESEYPICCMVCLRCAGHTHGKRIASASTDRTLAVWDVATGKELRRLKGHTGPVFGVMFSPDGKRIISGCWDKTVKLWDADTGAELSTLDTLPGPIRSVAFSPDGKRIVAGGGAPGRIADATVWSSR